MNIISIIIWSGLIVSICTGVASACRMIKAVDDNGSGDNSFEMYKEFFDKSITIFLAILAILTAQNVIKDIKQEKIEGFRDQYFETYLMFGKSVNYEKLDFWIDEFLEDEYLVMKDLYKYGSKESKYYYSQLVRCVKEQLDTSDSEVNTTTSKTQELLVKYALFISSIESDYKKEDIDYEGTIRTIMIDYDDHIDEYNELYEKYKYVKNN